MSKQLHVRTGVVAGATGLLGLFALTAATDSPLGQTSGGLWEVTGARNSGPVRQCVANTRALAQFEHRGENCLPTLVRESGDTAVFQYNCPSGGFGQSEVQVLTPRSLRIATQGISKGLPFSYVVQARRIGACAH